MKILYIVNARMPTEKAHGVQIMKMCEAFARSGAGVELVVPWRFNHITEDPFRYYDVEKLFAITQIPSIDLVRFGRFGFLIQAFSFALLASLYTLMKRVDFIYSRDEIPLWHLVFFKKNLVWEVHMPRENAIARVLSRHIKKIVTITQGLKDFYVSKGVPHEHILVAHDGVDIDDFSIVSDRKKVRSRLGLPSDKPIALYVGRLDRWKGVETLLIASKHLRDVQVVVVGEGDQLRQFQHDYPNVIFTGARPYRELPENQQAADVLVIPNSGEGDMSRLYTSPLKVFAHMTSGIPIVASDLPSIREVLHEQNAVLVEPDNPEALAAGIHRALSDTQSAVTRATQARHDVERYAWGKRAQDIVSFLAV